MSSRLEVIWGTAILDEGFTGIPNIIVRNYRKLGIEHGEWGFICTVLSYQHSKDEPYPSEEKVAENMNCNVRQIRKWIASLKSKNLMWVGRRRNRHNKRWDNNIYSFKPLIDMALVLVGQAPLPESKDEYEIEWENKPQEPQVPVEKNQPEELQVPMGFTPEVPMDPYPQVPTKRDDDLYKKDDDDLYKNSIVFKIAIECGMTTAKAKQADKALADINVPHNIIKEVFERIVKEYGPTLRGVGAAQRYIKTAIDNELANQEKKAKQKRTELPVKAHTKAKNKKDSSLPPLIREQLERQKEMEIQKNSVETKEQESIEEKRKRVEARLREMGEKKA